MKHIKIYFLIFSTMFTFSNIKVQAKDEKEEHILVISELPGILTFRQMQTMYR